MKRMRRLLPFAWILGVGILMTSIIGAGNVLQSRPEGTPNDKKSVSTSSARDGQGVVCFGLVDTEAGQMPLWPPLFPQPTMVKKVHPKAYEGSKVVAGDVLIEFDDEYAQLQVRKAQSALDEAKLKLDEINQKEKDGTRVWKRLITQQTAALEGKKYELRIAEIRYNAVKEAWEKKFESKATVDGAAVAIDAAKQAIIAEQDKLEQLKESKPDVEIALKQANAAVNRYQVLLEEANYGVSQCVLKAKTDGVILRNMVTEGLSFGPQSKQPALLFLPKGPYVIRAEVEQEFAHRVKLGQLALIYDDTVSGIRWKGKVLRIADSYLPRRTSVFLPDPFQLNESRILECIVSIEADSSNPPIRIGQRLRVSLGVSE